MSFASRVSFVVLWVVSVVLVAVLAAAQARQTEPVPSPTVVSGPDIGFRIEGRQGSTPVGSLVIRVNGQWVEAHFATGPRRLTDIR